LVQASGDIANWPGQCQSGIKRMRREVEARREGIGEGGDGVVRDSILVDHADRSFQEKLDCRARGQPGRDQGAAGHQFEILVRAEFDPLSLRFWMLLCFGIDPPFAVEKEIARSVRGRLTGVAH